MKAGIAKIDITPPLGAVLNGYYRERYADHVIEPLYVTALAFSDGTNTALAISLDISEILQRDTDQIRAQVAAHVGLPFEAVFLACIHTHTAPVISEIRSFFKRDEAYYREFCEKICRAAAEAIADMKESSVSIGRGEAKGISFVRRYRKKDGTTVTNPPPEDKDLLACPIGKPDETVQLVKLQRPGAADIAIVNFGTHPDVLGGTGICPDWPCYLRDTVEAALAREADGQGVRVIFFNGAQGDVAQNDRMRGIIRQGVQMSVHMGRTLAGAVLSIYTYTEPVNADRVFYKQNMAHAAVAKGTEEQVKIAKEIQELYLNQPDPWKFRYEGYPFDIVVARKYIRLEHREPIIPLNVVCVGFGDVAFVGLPGEPFTAIGVNIKAKSPFLMTIPCCNANGSEGYFPTDDALQEIGYEANSSLFLPGVAPELERVSLETLAELKNS
ncbi:MAG: hypothetical protein E7428_11480 [Ruminococcaceae bacterium]|nr:hypothetical protein [Oscillospiraceae bacterium]